MCGWSSCLRRFLFYRSCEDDNTMIWAGEGRREREFAQGSFHHPVRQNPTLCYCLRNWRDQPAWNASPSPLPPRGCQSWAGSDRGWQGQVVQRCPHHQGWRAVGRQGEIVRMPAKPVPGLRGLPYKGHVIYVYTDVKVTIVRVVRRARDVAALFDAPNPTQTNRQPEPPKTPALQQVRSPPPRPPRRRAMRPPRWRKLGRPGGLRWPPARRRGLR